MPKQKTPKKLTDTLDSLMTELGSLAERFHALGKSDARKELAEKLGVTLDSK